MLVIGSKYRTIAKLPDLNVGSTVNTPGEHVRNFGVIMDTKFTMEPHITKIMQIAFLKIRQISYYRKFLTPSAAKTLIHAYITSRLDYCNGLLYGLPTNLVAKLQSILKTAARLVTKTRKYEHITPVMINLHWLPIQYRIQFKLLLLIYKSLHGLAPSYLSDKLSLRPNKGLRSDNQLLLSQFPPLGLNFMEIGLSLLPGPHSGTHFLRTSGCVPPWQHLKPILKHIFLRKLTWHNCVPYRYILLQICFYYLHGFFTFITSLYQLCQSLVIIKCYILMLYHNCLTLTYFIALYVLFVFYVQRWRTLRFGAI